MTVESIETRKVKNGYIVTVNTEDGTEEHVFDHIRKVIKFLKELLDPKSPD